MDEKRRPVIERILKRIEDHVEEYRSQEKTRQAEVDAHRAELWEEAAERQRLLAEAVAEVEGDRLVQVVPGKGDFGGGRGIQGIKGSWLVFEAPE